MGSRRIGVRVEDGKEAAGGMPGLVPPQAVSRTIGTVEKSMHPSRVSDFGALEQSIGFRVEEASDIRNTVFNLKFSGQTVASDPLQLGASSKLPSSLDITLPPTRSGSLILPREKEVQPNLASLPQGHLENWGESIMADASPRTDTSTDDTDDRNPG
ncbi:hypothetical protein Taro_033660, partial [Colocasia esculenta]|nr:hypothetical protein [Colocasia esculenta]